MVYSFCVHRSEVWSVTVRFELLSIISPLTSSCEIRKREGSDLIKTSCFSSVMRPIGSSDSLGALISACPTTDEQSPRNSNFCNFQPLMEGLDDEGSAEEYGRVTEKKRRLSVGQVKALEKTFEVENKLEPERKVKLAQELGLQPRQVAVWFQNRRARWKTKQLERDYGVLRANYEALKANYDTLVQDNDVLHKEVKELKGRLHEDNNRSVKEEMDPLMAENTNPSTELSQPESVFNGESFKNPSTGSDDGRTEASLFPDTFKDGSSDSDSSAILNEDNCANAAISSPEILHSNFLLLSPPPSAFKFNALRSSSPTSALNCYGHLQKSFSPPQQLVKMEEHDFFSGDEACNFFSEEQAPTLPWYCSDQWS